MKEDRDLENKADNSMNYLLGWNEEFKSAFSAHKGPYADGRVVSRHKIVYEILIPGDSVIQVEISGALLKTGRQLVVGDFIVLLCQL